MEVVGEDGSQVRMKPGQTREIGRDEGLNTSDKTVSRSHISLSIPGVAESQQTRLQFEVLGRNPIYVSRDNEVKIFRRFERGEMGDGEMFCVSAKDPVWYTVRKIENGGEGVRRNDLESDLVGDLEGAFGIKEDVEHLHPDDVDISDVDPVKEFGFVVEGHEFDLYPKKMIKDIKDWGWFLEEQGENSEEDDDDAGKKGKSHGRRKRKKGTENDDEEWTGESEDEKMLIEKSRKAKGAKYITRSKDHCKLSIERSKSKLKSPRRTENREVDDEDDETLGGFIVDDENLEADDDEEEEEEEEFVEEDDDE